MKKRSKKIKAEVQTDFGLFEVVFERESDMGGYMVTVPKVPPVITWGKTIAHAKEMAREAIELTLETRILVEAEKTGRITLRRKARVPSKILTLA